MISKIIDSKSLASATSVFGHSSFDMHEQVVFCNDEDTGLKAIIGIHNTVLGPALGGTRMRLYNSEQEALNDVLRLSRGMTFKAAITGLDIGGGKAVIIGDAKTQKNEALIRRFAKFIDGLSGKFITAADMGMETRDMDIMREVTPYVTGISESKGGAGNPSPVTALGVFMGLKAAIKYRLGVNSLSGIKVLVQGVGHVGEVLVDYITKEGGIAYINDINKERLEFLQKKYDAKIIEAKDIYSLDVDVYAPCALGATLNDSNIPQLKVKVVAGAANNQLENELRHGTMLMERGIAYAPDFLINAGGIINIFSEIKNYGKDEIIRKTENIYDTTLEIFKMAKSNNCTTFEAAYAIAQGRIAQRKASRN